jgi:hypothetical protein
MHCFLVGQGLLIRNTLDVWHCENSVCENVMKKIFGAKDMLAVWEDLKECGIWPHLWLQKVVGRMIKPTRSFVLIDEKKKVHTNCWQFKNTISLCVFIKKEIHKDGEMKGMKSHDYHVMMQEILPLCLWNLMEKGYRMALIHLSHVLKKLCSKSYEPGHNGGS